MPWIVNPDGTATEIPWDHATRHAIDEGQDGQVYWGTLAGAVAYGGVQASAFDQVVVAEPVYDAREALDRPLSAGRPEPVGLIASYRVAAFEGQLQRPPLHPSNLPKLAPEPHPELDEPSF